MEGDYEELQRRRREAVPVPFPLMDGIPFPTFFPIRNKGVRHAMNDIKELSCRKSDIVICAWPKCGTHWLHEILYMLTSNSTELHDKAKSHTMLEALDNFKLLDALPSPRLLNTHLRFKYLPRELIDKKSKIIHIVRNPKDVCVSYYHHSSKDIFTKLECSWENYVEHFMNGQVAFGSWFDFVLEMEQADKDNPGLIYTCYYENLQKHPKKEISKLAEYIGIETSEEMVKEISEATTFENMQKNKFDITKLQNEGKGFIYRKGQTGDWKNYFTVAQNEKFDHLFREKMKESAYRIMFE